MTNNENEKASNTYENIGNWKQQAQHLKIKYPQLTESDLHLEAGKEEEMIKRMEMRLGKNREEILKMIKIEQTGNL